MTAVTVREQEGGFIVTDGATGTSFSVPTVVEAAERVEAGRPVRIVLDPARFALRLAALPSLARDKALEVLPFEMEGKFLAPSTELVFDYVAASVADETPACVVLAIRKDAARVFIEPFVRRGVPVASLTTAWTEELGRLGVAPSEFEQASTNFIPADLRGAEKKRSKEEFGRIAFRYAVAVLAVIAVGLAARLYAAGAKEKKLLGEVQAAAAAVFPGQKSPKADVTAIQTRMIELSEHYRLLKGVDAAGVLASLAGSAAGDVRLRELVIDGDRLSLKGEGRDMAAAERFRTNVAKVYPAARIVETKTLADGRTSFSVEALVAEN